MEDWTSEDMAEFILLVEQSESQNQLHRIESRLKFPAFIEKHSKDKCDRMFSKLTEND